MSPRQPSTTRRRKGSTGRRLTVVNITLQSEEWDYDKEVSLGGHDFRIVRIGTRGDIERAEELVWQWSLTSDAIAVTGAREAKAREGVVGGDDA